MGNTSRAINQIKNSGYEYLQNGVGNTTKLNSQNFISACRKTVLAKHAFRKRLIFSTDALEILPSDVDEETLVNAITYMQNENPTLTESLFCHDINLREFLTETTNHIAKAVALDTQSIKKEMITDAVNTFCIDEMTLTRKLNKVLDELELPVLAFGIAEDCFYGDRESNTMTFGLKASHPTILRLSDIAQSTAAQHDLIHTVLSHTFMSTPHEVSWYSHGMLEDYVDIAPKNSLRDNIREVIRSGYIEEITGETWDEVGRDFRREIINAVRCMTMGVNSYESHPVLLWKASNTERSPQSTPSIPVLFTLCENETEYVVDMMNNKLNCDQLESFEWDMLPSESLNLLQIISKEILSTIISIIIITESNNM